MIERRLQLGACTAGILKLMENADLRPGINLLAWLLDLLLLHKNASSEKQSLGHLADGRASLLVGTHSHVPTADARIMAGGSAYQTDAGMCGDYDSVIGMKKDIAMQRFMRKMPGERLAPAEGEATICGVFVESDEATGLARHVAPLRLGGKLAPAWPHAQAFKAVAE